MCKNCFAHTFPYCRFISFSFFVLFLFYFVFCQLYFALCQPLQHPLSSFTQCCLYIKLEIEYILFFAFFISDKSRRWLSQTRREPFLRARSVFLHVHVLKYALHGNVLPQSKQEIPFCNILPPKHSYTWPKMFSWSISIEPALRTNHVLVFLRTVLFKQFQTLIRNWLHYISQTSYIQTKLKSKCFF